MNKKITILIILIMLFSIASTGCISYQQSEACKLIPDSNLARAIRSELGMDRGETIYQSDLERLHRLYVDGWVCCFGTCRHVFNITGLEYAINLNRLRISNNRGINDFTPIANLTNLTNLHLDENQINDITFISNLTNLNHLSLRNNQISNISPLANLTNLTSLYLDENQISDISIFTNFTKLTQINLCRNQISDISPLTNLTNLTELDFWDNQISDISPLTNLTRLTQIRFPWNQISDISPLTNLTNLTLLCFDFNQISDIAPLVDNKGLSKNDSIGLIDNPLNEKSLNIYVPKLQKRGVEVWVVFDDLMEKNIGPVTEPPEL